MSFQLIIEKKSYTKSEILETVDDVSKDDYIQEIFSFLITWWSDSKFIVAQTSGSTGLPKKIKLEKQKMLLSAKATGLFFGFQEKSILCNPLPAKFIAGKMMLVRAILWDCTIHCLKPSSNPLKDVTSDYDFMVMTPHQLSIGLQNNSSANIQLVDTLLLGGSPLTNDLEEQLNSISTKIYIGYGMTETMSHIALRKVNGQDKSSYYKAVDRIRFDTDSRSCLEIHTNGLLDDVLVTNDVVELIDETEFHWLGRIDQVVNSGGIKLFPIQLEAKIAPFLSEPFYLYGTKDTILGEKLILYIESSSWNLEQSKLLKVKLKKVLQSIEIPKEIIPVETFKYTENGKLIRKEN